MKDMQLGIALWGPDYVENQFRFNDLFASADTLRPVTTPDETYIVLYWDDIPVGTEEVNEFLKFVQNIRHSVLMIREDGNIIKDVQTDDDRGCDGEFEEILNWTAHITVWGAADDVLEPSRKEVPTCRS